MSLELSCCRTVFLSEGDKGKPTGSLIQATGWMQPLPLWDWGTLFPCWFLAEACSQLSVALVSWSIPPSPDQQNVSSSCHSSHLSSGSIITGIWWSLSPSFSTFKDPCAHIVPTWIIQLGISISGSVTLVPSADFQCVTDSVARN